MHISIDFCLLYPLSDIILTLIDSGALAHAAEQHNMHPEKFSW